MSVTESIIQRRTQMLVHSYLYYVLDTSIVSDHTWQRWADDLTLLQRQHPQPVGFFDAEFADWDGTTGAHLPTYPWVAERAGQVLRLHGNADCRTQPIIAPASKSKHSAARPVLADLQGSLF